MSFCSIVLLVVFSLHLALGQTGPNSTTLCAKCHPQEAASYAASSMGKSIGPPSSVSAGKVSHEQSGSVISIEWRNGEMRHRLSENGVSATYSIKYQIGAGQVGHSYMAEADGYLLQSPASFYKRGGWDISPGFETADLLDFDRVVGESCLFCHSNHSNFSPQRRLSGEPPAAIGCERCHGDTSNHQRNPSSSNVINPAKLPVRARDSVCEQCHLEGLARIVNQGKTLKNFHPGDDLENTWTTYVARAEAGNIGSGGQAVSHVEQLALSRCASESGGRLWCGTCHDPHPAHLTAGKDRHAEIRVICSSCHATLSKANHTSAVSNCESCHMPRRSPTDVSHAAITDHRILKRASSPAPPAGTTPPQLRAWREPPLEFRHRNLGLADIEVSAKPGWESLGPAGAKLLAPDNATQPQIDSAVLSALGSVSLATGRFTEALPLLRRASELEPANGRYAMYTGIALKQSGDLKAAVEQLNRSIEVDPSLQRAYLELSTLLVRQHRSRDAAQTLDRYLQWNPQSILVRLARAALP